jgi:DNA invertase Pin-like site-specific DNA recombinase
MLKTALSYARVASSENATDTIKNQLEAIQNFAHEQGVKIICEYQDQCSSFLEHPELTKMISDIRSGKVSPNFIYVYDWSRLYRDPVRLIRIEKLLQKLGIEIISVDPPYEIPPLKFATYIRVGSEEQLN